ncbi:hypothetical protein EYF80_021867 [Liparis tanakae]|uniref:Uncharacterized protein n=1 Tax=Liparis tanakae TaxID=230148 RepID=A0A4Z2HQ08_9TELE|nr:hypothetical protein EYF80_021867 [Liparis tanakae]
MKSSTSSVRAASSSRRNRRASAPSSSLCVTFTPQRRLFTTREFVSVGGPCFLLTRPGKVPDGAGGIMGSRERNDYPPERPRAAQDQPDAALEDGREEPRGEILYHGGQSAGRSSTLLPLGYIQIDSHVRKSPEEAWPERANWKEGGATRRTRAGQESRAEELRLVGKPSVREAGGVDADMERWSRGVFDCDI